MEDHYFNGCLGRNFLYKYMNPKEEISEKKRKSWNLSMGIHSQIMILEYWKQRKEDSRAIALDDLLDKQKDMERTLTNLSSSIKYLIEENQRQKS